MHPVSPARNRTIPAAQYVRMSTEHQQYSTANQETAIKAFADEHGYRIVRTYSDEGRSGVSLAGRPALQQLLTDVKKGGLPFKAVLIYDVSRWGRFQDVDESAFHEYCCRSAGIHIEYCGEPFMNDGSPTSAIFKSIKRSMAGEYSRELSAKVSVGMRRLAGMGFHTGGIQPFGFQRVVRSADGRTKQVLRPGEWKSIQNDRVVLVPGPPEDIEIVRHVFSQYLAGNAPLTIAKELNVGPRSRPDGRQWTPSAISHVLANPKYMGTARHNMTRRPLHGKQEKVPPEFWLVRENAYEPIVTTEVFEAVRARRLKLATSLSEQEMVDHLNRMADTDGHLTGPEINASGKLKASTVAHRFGGLLAAYAKAGVSPKRDMKHVQSIRLANALRLQTISEIRRRLQQAGTRTKIDQHMSTVSLSDGFCIYVTATRCGRHAEGRAFWRVQLRNAREQAHLIVAALLDEQNSAIGEYLIAPVRLLPGEVLTLNERHRARWVSFLYGDLAILRSSAGRSALKDVS